jgi:hypothetical protein
MSYTKSFNELYRLSYAMGNLSTEVQYKRVAIYIGRVLMAETRDEQPTEYLDSPISGKMQWANELEGHREVMLKLVVEINDYEWKLIHEAMTKYASRSKGSWMWLNRRFGWISDLDSLRAFNS